MKFNTDTCYPCTKGMSFNRVNILGIREQWHPAVRINCRRKWWEWWKRLGKRWCRGCCSLFSQLSKNVRACFSKQEEIGLICTFRHLLWSELASWTFPFYLLYPSEPDKVSRLRLYFQEAIKLVTQHFIFCFQ